MSHITTVLFATRKSKAYTQLACAWSACIYSVCFVFTANMTLQSFLFGDEVSRRFTGSAWCVVCERCQQRVLVEFLGRGNIRRLRAIFYMPSSDNYNKQKVPIVTRFEVTQMSRCFLYVRVRIVWRVNTVLCACSSWRVGTAVLLRSLEIRHITNGGSSITDYSYLYYISKYTNNIHIFIYTLNIEF